MRWFSSGGTLPIQIMWEFPSPLTTTQLHTYMQRLMKDPKLLAFMLNNFTTSWRNFKEGRVYVASWNYFACSLTPTQMDGTDGVLLTPRTGSFPNE